MDNNGDIHKTNYDIFLKMGSCQESGYMLGHHDQDCGSGLENFIRRHFSFFLAILDNFYVVICVGYLVMVGKTAIYVIDIVKDVKFIVLFNSKRLLKSGQDISGLLDVGLAAAVGFLLASEIIKMVQMYNCRVTSKSHKVFRMLLSPLQLIPFLIHHLERELELRMCRLCAISEPTDVQEEFLTQTRNELASIRRLKGEHRSTENVLEHFVQFLLSVAVFVANATDSEKTIIFELSKSEIRFALLSTIISMFSMVRGQINLISSQKNGQLGLLATCLVAVYMVVAIFTRAIIIFISVIATYNLPREKFHNHGHLLFIFTTVAVALLHIIFSFLIQKKLVYGTKSNLKQALWSFLSPPLFLDWEYLHRKENYEIPIPVCWRRTRSSFLYHNLLTFVGNLAFGIPIYLSEDLWGTLLSITIVISAIVFQVILLGLGLLYFKKFHPWSRILNVELARAEQISVKEKLEQRPRRHSFSNLASISITKMQRGADNFEKSRRNTI